MDTISVIYISAFCLLLGLSVGTVIGILIGKDIEHKSPDRHKRVK